MDITRSAAQINSDMGEALGLHSFGHDEALMPLIDAANIACGFHAGDPGTMDATVALAARHGTAIGAHPGLPDLVGFGRREMRLESEEAEAIIRYQVGALRGFLAKHDLPLSHIKPHGSLYAMLARDEELMRAACRVARDEGVPLYGLAGSVHERVAEQEDVELITELYVDLDYRADGTLIVRRTPAARDPRLAAERVRRALRTGLVEAEDGSELAIRFRSVCVHSDAPGCVEVARAVREAIDEHRAEGERASGAEREGTAREGSK